MKPMKIIQGNYETKYKVNSGYDTNDGGSTVIHITNTGSIISIYTSWITNSSYRLIYIWSNDIWNREKIIMDIKEFKDKCWFDKQAAEKIRSENKEHWEAIDNEQCTYGDAYKPLMIRHHWWQDEVAHCPLCASQLQEEEMYQWYSDSCQRWFKKLILSCYRCGYEYAIQ
jgi:hypothetical protein